MFRLLLFDVNYENVSEFLVDLEVYFSGLLNKIWWSFVPQLRRERQDSVGKSTCKLTVALSCAG